MLSLLNVNQLNTEKQTSLVIQFRNMESGNISNVSTSSNKQITIKNLQPKFIHYLNSNHDKNRRATRKFRSTKNLPKPVQMMTLENFNIVPTACQPEKRENLKKFCYQGNKIQGQFKKGNLFGFCRIEYKGGEIFEGRCEYGIKIEGSLTFKDGTEYCGKFKEGLFHGPGVVIDPENRKISCYWNRGVPGKRGRIEYKTGQIYLGEIENLKKHGRGSIFLPDGTRYIGNFNKGHIEGFGELFLGEKKIFSGTWKDNNFQYTTGQQFLGK